ncbi:MAG TPA: S8 family serine peptidase [Myxococcota bacterium]|nr:S8 family serine peptidase [Myxococcota bacterium]
MRTLVIFFLLFTAELAGASPAEQTLSYFRADGRRVTLTTVRREGKLEIPIPGRRPVIIGRNIIARLRPGDNPRSDPFNDLAPLRRLRGLGNTWLLRARDQASAVRACAAVFESKRAVWAVPDFTVPIELMHVPDDPLYPQQWHLKSPRAQDIEAERAWDITFGDPQVVVAVLDTGVGVHPDLDPARMLKPRNILTGADDASPSNLAIDAHGTACMGLIAATADNQTGASGVCPLCSGMPVRIFDDFAQMATISQIAEGIGYAADEGAWVISNSWGIGQELIDQGGIDMTPLYEAVRHAVESGRGGKGCVVLFAAGNGDADLNAQPIGPDELPAMEETIAVGACGHDGYVARYSDYGPCVSLLAPSWSGQSGDPKILTLDTAGDAGYNKAGEHYKSEPGQGDISTGEGEPDAEGDYTRYFGGTSAATPIAAGVAGLVLSVNPNLTYLQLKDILQSTADKIGGIDYLDGRDDHYGYGRVNALRAVAVAKYGRDNPDGTECALDLNCLGVCRTDQPDAGQPTCATTCAQPEECLEDQDCLAGYCGPKEPEPVIEGGCGCNATAPGVLEVLPLLVLVFSRRRRNVT